MANFLLAFPSKIFQKILSYLLQGTLFRLIQCLRGVRDQALPFLYRDITLFDCRWKSIYARMDSSVYYLYRLVCRLLSHPELAAQVQRVTLRHATESQKFPCNADTMLAVNITDENLLRLMRRGCKNAKKLNDTKQILALDADNETLLAFLLPSLPNLQYLSMDFIPRLTSEFARTLNKKGFLSANQGPFQSLKTLVGPSSRHPQEGMSEQALAIFLGLPSLQSLKGHFPRQPSLPKSEGLLKTLTSNVAKIFLSGVQGAPTFICDTLRACHSLRHLELSWSDLSLNCGRDGSDEEIDALDHFWQPYLPSQPTSTLFPSFMITSAYLPALDMRCYYPLSTSPQPSKTSVSGCCLLSAWTSKS